MNMFIRKHSAHIAHSHRTGAYQFGVAPGSPADRYNKFAEKAWTDAKAAGADTNKKFAVWMNTAHPGKFTPEQIQDWYLAGRQFARSNGSREMKLKELTLPQLLVIWLAVALLVASFMYPPWTPASGFRESQVIHQTYGGYGYSWITHPPAFAGGIDVPRILMQAAAIVIVATATVLTMRWTKQGA